jgi:5-methylcytosine-specific restriction endonuclease McrA
LVEFYTVEPTPVSSWRMAILMGANTRTYKFALGSALLDLAHAGHEDVTLGQLAVPYAMAMARHVVDYPQAPNAEDLGEADYLRVLGEESGATLQMGQPTARLVDATVRSIPGMVMVKFHNLRGTDGVPHRFYEIERSGPNRRVLLKPELLSLANGEGGALLRDELGTRWSLVESAFDANIGPSLVRTGVVVSGDGSALLDHVRRASVAETRPALIGFQHGRCFYCRERLTELSGDTHVDHVYPYSLMPTGAWLGPDLNGVWNLVVAHAGCNLRKSSRLPDQNEVRQLIARNDAILASPHPLRRTLQLMLGSTSVQRLSFYRQIDAQARFEAF